MSRREIDCTDFVELLYRSLLGRDPDPDGYAGHLARLRSGAVGCEQLMSEFINCAEFKARDRREHAIDCDDPRVYAGYTDSDLGIFDQFRNAAVRPTEGFVTDFIGSRARVSLLWRGCEGLDGKIHPIPIPSDYHAEAIEWIGTLRAVLAAKNRFAMMELGAGHGPWLAASAKAAELRGIGRIVLCGVEPDPGRFALMSQNVKDNALEHYSITLIEAAVGTSDGTVRWPRIADPANDAGARPLTGSCGGDRLGDRGDPVRCSETIEIAIVSFGRLLARQPVWDLIHIDIQGSEVEICNAFADELLASARYLVVGTHSRKLDGDLMELMFRTGWHLDHEKPTRMAFSTDAAGLEQMTVQDGTQVWRNPRL